MIADWQREILESGFAILPRVYSANELAELIVCLDSAMNLAAEAEGPIRDKAGTVYAGRNLLRLFEPAKTIWRRSPLLELLRGVLGSQFGLVRVLFFDKPPERTWALPWHKDLTIAVKPHVGESTVFSKPTLKAGVPHVEASREVLEAMLTLRIHLDEMTDENGPLQIVPGSHRLGKVPVASYETARTILGSQGDVLAMRPMLAHRSSRHAKGRRCTDVSCIWNSPANSACPMDSSGMTLSVAITLPRDEPSGPRPQASRNLRESNQQRLVTRSDDGYVDSIDESELVRQEQ